MTLWQVFEAAATRFADRPAIDLQRQGTLDRWTYRQLHAAAEDRANWLASEGIAPGDRCAILADNDASWCAVYLGILAAFFHSAGIAVALAGAVAVALGHAWVHHGTGAGFKALAELLERTMQILINTLSFARVGAFALAHAGLSSAVVALAHATGTAGFIVVLIITATTGFIWVGRHQTATQATASRIVLVLSVVAGLIGVRNVWRSR